MKLAILRETAAFETRVATHPEALRKLSQMGLEVVVEAGAGLASGLPDMLFAAAGATIADSREAALEGAQILLTVQAPEEADWSRLAPGAVLAGMLSPFDRRDILPRWAEAGLSSFALELLPRTTRAQVMDVLSSQANLAGYRAVLEAAGAFGQALPMMSTAAGRIQPARVLIMGAGVAGLQAIATAKRLGAIVSATDVRAAAEEQVKSLGASFLKVESSEDLATSGGYAKETTAEYQARQAAMILAALPKTDIVITTALIPGRPAPRLITAEMVAAMRPGSVIVDGAVDRGGNVEGSQRGETVITDNGVKILGIANLPGRVAGDASKLYANNLASFLGLLVQKRGDAAPALTIATSDDLVAGTLLTHQGQVVHKDFAPAPAKDAA